MALSKKQQALVDEMSSPEGKAALTAVFDQKMTTRDLEVLAANANLYVKNLMKRTFPVGTRVRLVGTRNAEIEGKVGTVVKQNPKRLSVFLDDDHAEWMTPLDKMSLAEKRDYATLGVPPVMLEVVEG